MKKSERIIELLLEFPGMTTNELNKHFDFDICPFIPNLIRSGRVVRKGQPRKYRYYAVRREEESWPAIPLAELSALMDAPVFRAVRRRTV